MSAATEREQQGWQIARDRVLLYVRAMNLPPFGGLELALRSLERSGPASHTETKLTIMGSDIINCFLIKKFRKTGASTSICTARTAPVFMKNIKPHRFWTNMVFRRLRTQFRPI